MGGPTGDGCTAQPTVERLVRQARVAVDHLGPLSVVGLLLKDTVPLGYGEGPSLTRGAEYQAAHFFDYFDG